MQPSAQQRPRCEACPYNLAYFELRNDDTVLVMCECCALAEDEEDGWTIVPF